MDYIAAIIGFAGVALGALILGITNWLARKDKYKDMVFEKRLDAHQGAHYWCMRLMTVMRPDRITRKGGVAAAVEKNQEALEWLNKNALYLDQDSRLKMVSFVKYIGEASLKYRDEEWRTEVHMKEETLNVVMRAAEAATAVEKGIGVEYLPKQKALTENMRWIEIEEELDRILESRDIEL